MSASTDGAVPAVPAAQVWTTRALFARHKALGIGAVLALILLVVFIAGAILSSKPLVVSDSSTCSTWSSANQTQQQAYARQYLRQRGSLPGGATSAAAVITAINIGCTDAFDNDTQDDITIVKAITQQ